MQLQPVEFYQDGKKIHIFPGPAGSPAVYVNSFEDDGSLLCAALKTVSCPAHSLIVISGLDWDNELSPWPCPLIYKGESPFTGQAGRYLTWMQEVLIPLAERKLADTAESSGMNAEREAGRAAWTAAKMESAQEAETGQESAVSESSVPAFSPAFRCLAGSSLAGLFALFALFETDLFSRAASISGSLWYPNLAAFVRSHTWKNQPDCIYFSIGDREARTRNPLFRTVQKRTEEIYGIFRDRGIRTICESNRGNSFEDPKLRIAKGISWMLSQHGTP